MEKGRMVGCNSCGKLQIVAYNVTHCPRCNALLPTYVTNDLTTNPAIMAVLMPSQ